MPREFDDEGDDDNNHLKVLKLFSDLKANDRNSNKYLWYYESLRMGISRKPSS